MPKYILRRNDKYLSEFYQWGDVPNLFPEYLFQDVLDEAMNYKDKPTDIGRVDGDLDQAEWFSI